MNVVDVCVVVYWMAMTARVVPLYAGELAAASAASLGHPQVQPAASKLSLERRFTALQDGIVRCRPFRLSQSHPHRRLLSLGR
jgi:hypothetical protein